jgi:hypothetical protein
MLASEDKEKKKDRTRIRIRKEGGMGPGFNCLFFNY